MTREKSRGVVGIMFLVALLVFPIAIFTTCFARNAMPRQPVAVQGGKAQDGLSEEIEFHLRSILIGAGIASFVTMAMVVWWRLTSEETPLDGNGTG
jgi:hypothetical protein